MATTAMAEKVINTTEWIDENKQYFLPPVCNKMMYNEGQMKLFFVGGPNQRKDYHLECGEELFLQLKGDMVLKIREKNKHRDIVIKEGQIFLLPGRIEHSPQRYDGTVGLVLERDRHPSELDGLRYFTEDAEGNLTHDTLYETFFYCTDLGSQLGPIIKTFFASEQCATGKPKPETMVHPAPFALDTERAVEDPFDFNSWLSANSEDIDKNGFKQVFDASKYQFQVYVYGKGENGNQHDIAETWLWQWSGSSTVHIGDEQYRLVKSDSILVPAAKPWKVVQEEGCRTLVCFQDPTKSSTYPK